jgi:hypothetical protein
MSQIFVAPTKVTKFIVKKRLYCTTTREREREAHTGRKKKEIFSLDHFESLLITRINAAFSSFRRVLSDLIESIFFKSSSNSDIFRS